MSTATNTVRGRVEQARIELTPAQVALGIVLLAILGLVLLFLQEPLVHDSLHNFRHVAGITCH